MDKISEYIPDILIQQRLADEEYDTDAVAFDLQNYRSEFPNSNIKPWLDVDLHDDVFDLLYHRIKNFFATGFKFYYWDKWKTIDETFIQHQPPANIDYHSGYSPKQLYVSQKYNSLKFEILNNKIYSLNIAQLNISIRKALKYLNTNKIKTITCLHYLRVIPNSDHVDSEFVTGMKRGNPMSINHILSILLYTDWSELSSEFSNTFRKHHVTATFALIKKRNREFANFSRFLMETIMCFGNLGYSRYFKFLPNRYTEKMDFETGPFYCGLSRTMVISCYNIRLYAPTSTTKQLEVAHRFTDDCGMIVQLNNNGHHYGFQLTSWNCSWLSNYVGEDERIWMGGLVPIKIEGIRIVSTSINYQKYFQSLYYLDCMLT
eukprot:136010_1